MSQLDMDLDALRLGPSRALSKELSAPKITKTPSNQSIPVSRTSSTTSVSKTKHKKLNLKEEYAKRATGKEHLNLVVVG